MKQSSRRDFLKTAAALPLANIGGMSISTRRVHAAEPNPYPKLPEATYKKLPRWRGFNLLNYFYQSVPFAEKTFRDIADLGFNFVRLPLDYRQWIREDDWNKIDSGKLDEIISVITLGEKYRVHVQFNFHHAPGYTVAKQGGENRLWTDLAAQEASSRHWAEFARRCRGVENRQVSFNLVNEPDEVAEEVCVPVCVQMIEAIRAEDPQRLIVCDGRRWARVPMPSLIPHRVAQATRGYDPMPISHYGASWVESDAFPPPQWPMRCAQGVLLSPNKKEVHEILREPLRITGPFDRAMRLRMRVGIVSLRGVLVVEADGREIFRREFLPKEGEGEWKKATLSAWGSWKNFYGTDYSVTIPAGTKTLAIKNLDGDWMSLMEIGVAPLAEGRDEPECTLGLIADWEAILPKTVEYRVEQGVGTLCSPVEIDGEFLREKLVEPWQQLETAGVGVMVGEFGAFHQTPHDVTLRWMESMLANWHAAGWGFALWNWEGAFGVVHSGRSDVDYEEWRGQKLDRKMVELMLKY